MTLPARLRLQSEVLALRSKCAEQEKCLSYERDARGEAEKMAEALKAYYDAERMKVKDLNDKLSLCLSEGCDAYEISEIARLEKEVEVWSRKYADLEAEYLAASAGYAPSGAESAGYELSPKAGLEAQDAQAPGDGRDKAGPASPVATRAAFDEARKNLFHERDPK